MTRPAWRQLDVETEFEDEDSVFEELTRAAAPKIRFTELLETMAGGDLTKKTADDLTKKIAQSTQLKPKDVQAVFAALQAIAYADLKTNKQFVIPGVCQLKARRMRRERHGRTLTFGNFRLEVANPAPKAMEPTHERCPV